MTLSATPASESEVICLLAHPDDEIFCAPTLIRFAPKANITIYYLTTGHTASETQTREIECRKALKRISDKIVVKFLGRELGVVDGNLMAHLIDAIRGISGQVKQATHYILLSHAWEGGHPDHDAVHLIARRLGATFPNVQHLEFYCYNGKGLPSRLFKVATPMERRLPFTRFPARRKPLLIAVRMILDHRSQAKSWVGLAPLLILRWLIVGYQELFEPNREWRLSRPHQGQLLYEVMFHVPYAKLERHAQEMLATSPGPLVKTSEVSG